MRNFFFALLFSVFCSICHAATAQVELGLGSSETYTVKETDKWSVNVLKYMMLREARIKILPKEENKSFNLELFFKADTDDIAMFNTPEKMKTAVLRSSEKYLPGIVEKKIVIEDIHNKGWYGYKTKFTDKDLLGKKIPPNEYLYMIRGMIRLSENSALGFSLMTNDPDSAQTKSILDYIYSFAHQKN